MIPYVGDLSKADAEVLAVLADKSNSILEFGCGASTQVFAAYGKGTVESVETDPAWVCRTQANLARLEIEKHVTFHTYSRFQPKGPYDLIFVDGLNELRLPFALLTWDTLAIGGMLCFHDTRRRMPVRNSTLSDVEMVCQMIERYSEEVHTVWFNLDDSNTTVILKRKRLVLEDWNAIEGRTPAQLGLE